jgi:hypothetical protein
MADNAAGGAAASTGGSTGGNTTGQRIDTGGSTTTTSTGATGGTGSAGDGSAAGPGGSSGSSAAPGGGSSSGQTGATGAAASADGGGSAAGSTGAGENWDAAWREKWANNDEKRLNWAKRFASPSAMLDGAWSAHQKISSGELKAPLPKEATAEQLAAYRKDNGIPEKPEGYLEKLPQGLSLDDTDREILKPYTELMHKHNLSPEQAGEFLQIRAKVLEDLTSRQLQNDKTMRTQVEDTLRSEWGNEYRANVNNIHTLLAGAPEEVRDALNSARTADGLALFNDAATMKFFAQLARQINPFGTIVNADGGAMDQKGVEGRITEIEGLMRKAGSEYWKGPKADAMQKEYRDLIDARERVRQRVA